WPRSFLRENTIEKRPDRDRHPNDRITGSEANGRSQRNPHQKSEVTGDSPHGSPIRWKREVFPLRMPSNRGSRNSQVFFPANHPPLSPQRLRRQVHPRAPNPSKAKVAGSGMTTASNCM